MTTIAVRGNIMASDSRETVCDDGETAYVVNNKCKKIWRVSSGRILGCAHGSEDGIRLMLALKKNQPPPKLDAVVGVLLNTDGSVELYEGNIWQKVSGDYYAVGSGALAALGAMDAGATAVEAVKIAIDRDPFSGGRLQVLKLRRKR